jgi:hypothetical protein
VTRAEAIHNETYGRAVYDCRWACWKACCGQYKPTADCKNPALHEAIRALDLAWVLFVKRKP